MTNQELPTLEKTAAKLRVEISKLVDVLAAADLKPRSVVQRIAQREEELGDVEARIRAAKAAPDAINLELRRMELEVKKRITDLRSVLERDPEEARAVMAALFSKLTFTPVQTADGPRYRIEGDAAIGRMVATEGVVSNVASPGGFEPPLAT